MKKAFSLLFCALLVTATAFADNDKDKHKFKDKDHDDDQVNAAAAPGGRGNLLDHGGEVMTNAKVVYIFWGPTLSPTSTYVKEVIAFRDDPGGMMKHIGMLAQYRSTGSTSLKGSQPDVFDTSNPPTKVTDTLVMQKVAAKCAALAGGCRTDTIYEVLIPPGTYSDDGTGATSCGGPNLQYCAYHGNGDGVSLSASIKYSIQPYPGCSGCHGKSNWLDFNDQEHFIVHETREAMSDARLNAWYDRAGYEADDKCAWGGATLAFLFDEAVGSHTFAYQMEYSNSTKSCVK
jgi:hypothetical protein